jgi:hypothetical protein
MLPVVILLRKYKDDCTLGTVILPSGKVIKSIERRWLDNRRNISCYPEGIYLAKWLERSASGKYKRVWHVQDVPNRTGILWHAGNLVRHSLGCTLPGMRHGTLGGMPAVLASGNALNEMRRELEGQDFILVVGGALNG